MDAGNQTSKTIRVLHVVGGMNRGGVETWLMHVLCHIDRERFRMDFLVHTDSPCRYDEDPFPSFKDHPLPVPITAVDLCPELQAYPQRAWPL